jgi:serine/threonine protein kinase
VLEWFHDLDDYLPHIHIHDMLHHDLKSQQIFLDDFLHHKTGDFGIAKTLKIWMILLTLWWQSILSFARNMDESSWLCGD